MTPLTPPPGVGEINIPLEMGLRNFAVRGQLCCEVFQLVEQKVEPCSQQQHSELK